MDDSSKNPASISPQPDSAVQNDFSARPAAPPVPRRGPLLGLDYGTKRVGLAISNDEQTIASPVDQFERRGARGDADYLTRFLRTYRVAGLVVGLPMHMNGSEGQKAHEARQFGQWAAEVTGLPVDWWDERCTTAVAEDLLLEVNFSRKKRKARLDKIAAQLMLQGYLDARRRETGTGC